MRKFPDIVFGALLAVALLAVGLVIGAGHQPTPRPSNEQGKRENDKQIIYRSFSDWIWQDASGFFTFGLVLIGGLQLGLFYWQLRLMREGTEDTAQAVMAANKSAQAARVQADTARETLKTMQETAQRQLRAYVVIKDPTIRLFPQNPLGATKSVVGFRNTGQTPAYNFRISGYVSLQPVLDEARLVVPVFDQNYGTSTLAPGAEEFVWMDQQFLPANQFAALAAHGMAAYLHGIARYEDIFKRTWTLNYRAVTGLGRGMRYPQDDGSILLTCVAALGGNGEIEER